MAKAAGRVVGRFREGLLPWDTSPGVLIPRPEELREKLSHFESSKMHIVADFDYTLTRAWHPSGERGVSSHLLVQRNPAFGEHFRERSNALFNKVAQTLSSLLDRTASQCLLFIAVPPD